jgi:hypothetical protein
VEDEGEGDEDGEAGEVREEDDTESSAGGVGFSGRGFDGHASGEVARAPEGGGQEGVEGVGGDGRHGRRRCSKVSTRQVSTRQRKNTAGAEVHKRSTEKDEPHGLDGEAVETMGDPVPLATAARRLCGGWG